MPLPTFDDDAPYDATTDTWDECRGCGTWMRPGDTDCACTDAAPVCQYSGLPMPKIDLLADMDAEF